MENGNFCQSCSMPLDNGNMAGTEKDGSLSHEYCKYCYQNGTFINPHMTFGEMKSFVTAEMQRRSLPPEVIEKAIDVLPYLKRWAKHPESTVISI